MNAVREQGVADRVEEVRWKVLVVDDELGPRESLRMLLKKRFEVRCAESVDLGIAYLVEEPPDVVIMDIRMPGDDGIEGLRRLREVDRDVAVIMHTGYGSLETARDAIRLGADDYVQKPFDVKDLVELVHEHAGRSAVRRRQRGMERELKELNAQLQLEMEEKDQLAGLGHASKELVHDLRSPLCVVQGCTELLSQELEDMREGRGEDARPLEYLEVIEKSLVRCTELLNDWRKLGAKEGLTLESETVGAFLGGIRDEAEMMARERGVELVFKDETAEGERISVDPTQLPRALMNLIGNALDAVKAANGRVELRVARKGEEVWMEVVDDGEGIPEENLEKIFEPDFTTKPLGRGTGLGLYISRRIAEKHGGALTARSRLGEGATFTLRLPADKG